MTTGIHAAARCVSAALRGAQIAVLPKEALRGVQIEIATRVTGEESRPETPHTTGEEGTVIAETTEREVGLGYFIRN